MILAPIQASAFWSRSAWRGRRAIQILVLGALYHVASAKPALANMRVEVCPNNPGCVCVTWWIDPTFYVEERCSGGTGGWVPAPPPPGSPPNGDGSWGFSTTWGSSPPPQTPPFNDFQNGRITTATEVAKRMVAPKKIKPPDITEPHYFVQTTCTALFWNNRLGVDSQTAFNAARFVNGTGYRTVVNGQLVDGCSALSGTTYAFVDPNRGPNDRYIFLCPSFFGIAPPDNALMMIHEVLHITGQTENRTSSAGPGDPPSSAGIQAAVEAACEAPRTMPTE